MSTETTKAAAATGAKARTRHPSYDVYRHDDDGTLDLIGTDVKAPTRREAIVKAVAELAEDRQYGKFATVKHGELKSDTRGRKVEPQDVWS